MKTIGIVASGPSLTLEDCQTLRKNCDEVIAVNDSFRMVLADYLYGADYRWWLAHHADVACGFGGEKWSCETKGNSNWGKNDASKWGINLLHCNIAGEGLSKVPGEVVGGGNSGYQSIGLAYHLKATRIILLGYDMTWTGGRSHFFGDHPSGLQNVEPDRYIAAYRTIKPKDYDIEIINCSRHTALDAFERRNLEDVF